MFSVISSTSHHRSRSNLEDIPLCSVYGCDQGVDAQLVLFEVEQATSPKFGSSKCIVPLSSFHSPSFCIYEKKSGATRRDPVVVPTRSRVRTLTPSLSRPNRVPQSPLTSSPHLTSRRVRFPRPQRQHDARPPVGLHRRARPRRPRPAPRPSRRPRTGGFQPAPDAHMPERHHEGTKTMEPTCDQNGSRHPQVDG